MICNLTLVGEITSENAMICSYANYHIFMLISCGMLSFGCLIRGAVQYTICKTPLYIVERDFFMGMLFLVFALGFEVAILLLCICLFKPCKCEKKVAPSDNILVIIEQNDNTVEEETDSPSESSLICPICLDLAKDDDGDKWLTTKCNHSFHIDCIKGWDKNSCPICRKPLYF